MRRSPSGGIVLLILVAGCAAPPSDRPPDSDLGSSAMACPAICSRPVTEDPWWGWEPSIGVDPLDPAHLVVGIHDDPWAASPHGSGTALDPQVLAPGVIRISSAASFDGGATWQRRFLPIFPEAPPGSLWGLVCNQGDPIVQFAPDGRLFLFGLGIGCSDSGLLLATSYVFVTESADGGLTWREPTFIWQGTGAAVQFNDKPGATIDQATGHLVIAWTTFSAAVSAATLMVSTSADGTDWSTPEPIVTDANVGNQGVETGIVGDDFQNHYAMPVQDLEGNIHVAFRACNRACIKVASGGPGDWSIQEVAHLSGGSRERPYSLGEPLMTLAVDPGGPSPGRIYLAYADALDGLPAATYSSGGADWDVDIVAQWSDDGGATWSDAVAVSPADDGDQFHPWMQAEDGVLHLFYLDRVPGGPQVQATYGRHDVTAGTGFEVHLDAPWEPNPEDHSIPAFGHYESLEVEDGRVALAWTRVVGPKPDQEAYSKEVGFDRDVSVAYWDGVQWR